MALRLSNADKGWCRRFDDPIPLPRGRQLVTLQDAGNYITKLPKTEHDAKEWPAAMEALLLVAEHDGPTMFARIGVMQALNRNVVRELIPITKTTTGGAANSNEICDGPLRRCRVDRDGYRRSQVCD
jgi:hypothetical protein